MIYEMTRKSFLQTLAGAAVAGSIHTPAPAAAVARPKIKLGVSLYSYGGDFLMGTMGVEDCIADIADMDADGVEILGEAHIPNYPNPPAKWIDQWFGWMEKYKTKPTAYDLFLDFRLRKGQILSVQESVDSLVRDFKLANTLGFKTMRTQNAIALGFGAGTADVALYGAAGSAVSKEVVEKALPFAEKYDVKMAVEMHSPAKLKTEWIDRMLEYVDKTKTRHLGLMPDMSIFTKRPPDRTVQGLIEQGARKNIIEFIIKSWQEDMGPDKTMDEVKKMGGNQVEIRYASVGGLYHSSHNNPKDIVRLIPYIYHIHAKIHDVTEDLHEPGIDYDSVVPVLARGGFDSYWSTEYEGSREIYDASITIRRQHRMLRNLWDAA